MRTGGTGAKRIMLPENINDDLPISWVKSVTNDGKIYYKHDMDNVIRWEGSNEHNEFKQEEYNMTNNGSFKYNINGDQYVKIIQSKVGEMHESQIFQMLNLKWRIWCYPNGRNQKEKDSFKIYIRLLNIPNEWKSILVQYKIECIETNASCTTIEAYDHDQSRIAGWGDKHLLLSELKGLDLNEINIKISLKIIRIISNNINNNRNILYYNIIPIKTKEIIKWEINQKILTQFNNSYFGKPFQSQINNNNPFIITFIITKYHFRIYLTLIHLPFQNGTKIKITYTLSCDQDGINQDYTNTSIFSTEQNSQGIEFRKNKFKPNSPNPLTLTANYKIISIYDFNGKEFAINKWNICSNKYNYYELFSNKLSWQCIKCKQINKQKYISCIKCKLNREYNNKIYLQKLTCKEIQERVSKWSNIIPNYNNILMDAAVKEEKDGIVFHLGHPSCQKIMQLVKDYKENETKLLIHNNQSQNQSNNKEKQSNNKENDHDDPRCVYFMAFISLFFPILGLFVCCCYGPKRKSANRLLLCFTASGMVGWLVAIFFFYYFFLLLAGPGSATAADAQTNYYNDTNYNGTNYNGTNYHGLF